MSCYMGQELFSIDMVSLEKGFLEKRASLPGFPVYIGMNAKSNVLAVPTKINQKKVIH